MQPYRLFDTRNPATSPLGTGEPLAPELVRRIATEGHTIGHHTWLHRSLMRIKPSQTTEEIDQLMLR